MWYSEPECSGVSASAKDHAWTRAAATRIQKRVKARRMYGGQTCKAKIQKADMHKAKGNNFRTVYESMLVESFGMSERHVMALRLDGRDVSMDAQ